jgi:hypothetical protein
LQIAAKGRSKRDELNVSKSSPLCPIERTSISRAVTSLMTRGSPRRAQSWSALPQSGDIRGCSGLTYHEGPPGPTNSFAMVGVFLREWSSEIDGLIAAARHIRGAVELHHRRRQRRNDGDHVSLNRKAVSWLKPSCQSPNETSGRPFL